MASWTALGRVQPLFKGAYNPSTTYYKLENVEYNGSTWVCVSNAPITGIEPADNNYWKLVAHKGDQGIQGNTGSFGQPTGNVTILPSGSDPDITITASGPDTAKIFNFDFDLPAGPVGYDEVAASATPLSAGSPPTASAALVTEDDTTTLTFSFGIPAADGSGVQSVDGIPPSVDPGTGLQDVELSAVSYARGLSLSESQKNIARTNIDALRAPSNPSTGQFLQYSELGTWEGTNINLVPSGSSADIGKYLRKTGNGMLWAEVQSLPSGGNEGAPLIKNSVDNYDVTWGSFISSSMIDNIVDA